MASLEEFLAAKTRDRHQPIQEHSEIHSIQSSPVRKPLPRPPSMPEPRFVVDDMDHSVIHGHLDSEFGESETVIKYGSEHPDVYETPMEVTPLVR
jgi:hypothetical protein